MNPYLVDVVIITFIVVSVCIAYSIYAYQKRRKLQMLKEYKMPSSSNLSSLRSKDIPIIESVPFWVPSHISDVIDIEVQPSIIQRLGPKGSTPTRRPMKSSLMAKKPKLKFSVKYHSTRSTLVVDLLESKNVGKGNLVYDTPLLPLSDDSSSDESTFSAIFNPVELIPAQPKCEHQFSRSFKRIRKNSYELEMDYDELQVQMLQFSVMAYDEYSRQKVLGDVILPIAEFTNQGLDITKELLMWRDVQIMEKRYEREEESMLMDMDTPPRSMNDSRCSPS